jgi:hypothetical protein
MNSDTYSRDSYPPRYKCWEADNSGSPPSFFSQTPYLTLLGSSMVDSLFSSSSSLLCWCVEWRGDGGPFTGEYGGSRGYYTWKHPPPPWGLRGDPWC